MSKASKTVETPKNEPTNKAVDALVEIADVVLQYREDAKPSLSEVARITGRASGLLRIKDGDERTAIANMAAVAIAKKYNLVG